MATLRQASLGHAKSMGSFPRLDLEKVREHADQAEGAKLPSTFRAPSRTIQEGDGVGQGSSLTARSSLTRSIR